MSTEDKCLTPIYCSVGCNRSPHCMSWHPKHGLIFAACNAVAVAQRSPKISSTSGISNAPIKVTKTLVGHSDRVNCVRWLKDLTDRPTFVSASTDGTVVLWQDWATTRILKGHTSSVTVVTPMMFNDRLMVASTGGDSTIRIWVISSDSDQPAQIIALPKSGLAFDLKLFMLDDSTPALVAAQDDSRIHIYACVQGVFQLSHSLSGHEDWSRAVDCLRIPTNNEVLLASGGQDSLVRVWKISPRSEEEYKSERKSIIDLSLDEDIKVKEDMFYCGQKRFFAVSLETVLAGHEDKVFGVEWAAPNLRSNSARLLTCSLDKTMIVWNSPDMVSPIENLEERIWNEEVRVGDVGGNVLGFMGACNNPHIGEEEILGYSFNGAFHSWIKDGGKWICGVVPSGHFGPVEDLDWQMNGRYFTTVSSDQTSRIHAPWMVNHDEIVWREIARPQVHGYDLTCLATLPKSSAGHAFASGAEEKIVRIFQTTQTFLDSYQKITNEDLNPEEKLNQSQQAQGASVPSLGLSNKAVFSDESSLAENERHVKDQYPDHYFRAPDESSQTVPPPEETLVQNTLWPEETKLYAHGFDIFSVATSTRGDLLATACKAAKAEDAEIVLWSIKSWEVEQKLSGHSLTVTQMEFRPWVQGEEEYLLSVSRDRTWCLFGKKKSDLPFEKVAFTDKKNALHSRLIWGCSWSSDGKHFATCSRDKKVAVWTNKAHKETASSSLGSWGLACYKPLVLEESVTAVAFAPASNDHGYVIAAGLETGEIVLVSWDVKANDSEWKVLQRLNRNDGHHKAVKKLKFVQRESANMFLASCSRDHSVKLYDVSLPK